MYLEFQVKKRSLSYQPQVNDMLLSLDSSPSPHLPISSFGPGGNAIAQAASQAIAATQQLTGRRTSSLKASFEAVNLGMQSHEFSIGRDYAGAASMAAAAAASSSSSQVVYMPPSFWLLAFESRDSCDLFQAEKEITSCKAEQIHQMTFIFTQNGPRLSF